MNREDLYRLYLEHRIISTDSRDIKPGSLFFALKGEHFNGNRFAREALEKGAAAAIVDEVPESDHPRIFQVEQVLTTLQQLAAWHRRRSGFRILAITGSNGKTTTKELCRAVLSKKYAVHATTGNLNNHIGVPLTLLAMDQTEVGIVEMGANHPGEIRALCSIAAPDYGLITNIGKAHLEGFNTLEGVARAKGELFTYLTDSGGTIFLNEGNKYLKDWQHTGYDKMICYNGKKGLQSQDVSCQPFLELTVTGNGISTHISTALLGCYNSENVLAACAVGQYMGVPFSQIREAVEEYRPGNNRSQLIETRHNRVFMDAYNANPSSMLAALEAFLQMDAENRLAIVGEMREVGTKSQDEHENLVGYLRDQPLQQVYCVGQSFTGLISGTKFRHFTDVDDLIRFLQQHPVTGTLVLLKGSRSNQLEKALPYL